jgi:ubiquinone biosynthesis protein
MNTLGVFRLLHELFGPGLPNVDRIQKLGLLAVKIGQLYAVRPDFLSEDKCRALAVLYRKAERSTVANARALLHEDAPDLAEALASFDEVPSASASIGQVHKATLKMGEKVAIKLVKGDVVEGFRDDVRRAKHLFSLVSYFYPKLRGVANPVELIGEIEQMTLAELDLRHEVAGYRLLAEIRDKGSTLFDLKRAKFPHVYEAFCGERVLVTEFIDAPTMDEMIDEGTLRYEQLLEFFRIHGYFMYEAGIFHGDIHPGNIMIGHDGSFYFLDAGYIGRVGERIRINLFHFFDALSWYDFPKAAHFLAKMSETELSPAIYKTFEADFLALYEGFEGKTVGEVSLTKKMMQTIRMGVLAGMNFPTGMFDVVKSHMYLDGMVLRVNPQAKLLEDMRPFIDEFKQTFVF